MTEKMARKFCLLALSCAVSSCASFKVFKASKVEGDAVTWSDSKEEMLVLDPNAPALPYEGVTLDEIESEQPKVVTNTTSSNVAEIDDQSLLIEDTQKRVLADADTEKTIDALQGVPNSEDALGTDGAEENVEALAVSDGARPRGVFVTTGSGPQRRYIKADQIHIRISPDRYSRSVGFLYGGDEVRVRIEGDWAKLDEGRWVRSRWLVKKRPTRFKGGPSGGAPERQIEGDSNTASTSGFNERGLSSRL